MVLTVLILGLEMSFALHTMFKGIDEPKPWRTYFEFNPWQFVRSLEVGLVFSLPFIALILVASHHGFQGAWRSACRISLAFLIPVFIWGMAMLCTGAGSDTQGPGEQPPAWLLHPVLQFLGGWWWMFILPGLGIAWLMRDMKKAVGHTIPLQFWKTYETKPTWRDFATLACVIFGGMAWTFGRILWTT